MRAERTGTRTIETLVLYLPNVSDGTLEELRQYLFYWHKIRQDLKRDCLDLSVS